jgi:hypothetical protein
MRYAFHWRVDPHATWHAPLYEQPLLFAARDLPEAPACRFAVGEWLAPTRVEETLRPQLYHRVLHDRAGRPWPTLRRLARYLETPGQPVYVIVIAGLERATAHTIHHGLLDRVDYLGLRGLADDDPDMLRVVYEAWIQPDVYRVQGPHLSVHDAVTGPALRQLWAPHFQTVTMHAPEPSPPAPSPSTF